MKYIEEDGLYGKGLQNSLSAVKKQFFHPKDLFFTKQVLNFVFLEAKARFISDDKLRIECIINNLDDFDWPRCLNLSGRARNIPGLYINHRITCLVRKKSTKRLRFNIQSKKHVLASLSDNKGELFIEVYGFDENRQIKFCSNEISLFLSWEDLL